MTHNPSSPPTIPSTKFVGRPAKLCSKCKGAWHWVNTMGGISCVTCQPAPTGLTDVESRWLVVDAGIWNQPDDFVHQSPDHERSQSGSSDHATSTSTTASGHTAFEPDSRLLDVFSNVESIPADSTNRKWTLEDQELVTWWMDLTAPRSESLATTTSQLMGQRLSASCAVIDAGLMIQQLRLDCERGADGPRELHGCLLYDLRELREWLNRHSSEGSVNEFEIDLTGIEF